MSTSGIPTNDFDLQEYQALREEILQKVAAISRLERLSFAGAAAIFAWVATRDSDPERWIWWVPLAFAAGGWIWAKKLGHQAYLAGQYILILEKRLRPDPIEKDFLRQSLPVPRVRPWLKRWLPLAARPLDRLRPVTVSDSVLSKVYGWEGFIRVPFIRGRFLDWMSDIFWIVFVGLSLWTAIHPPMQQRDHDDSRAPEADATDAAGIVSP